MITYTWKFKIQELVPYNINSHQRDLIRQLHYKLIGTKGTKRMESVGLIVWGDVDEEGVPENFMAIDTITQDTLQTWVENQLGATRIAEIKADMEANIDSLPDDLSDVGT